MLFAPPVGVVVFWFVRAFVRFTHFILIAVLILNNSDISIYKSFDKRES